MSGVIYRPPSLSEIIAALPTQAAIDASVLNNAPTAVEIRDVVNPSVTSISNTDNSLGSALFTTASPHNQMIGKKILSGALVTGVLKKLVDIGGGGYLRACGIHTEDATARVIRLQVVIDGAAVCDMYSPTISTTWMGIYAVGNSTSSYASPENMRFNSRLEIYVQSQLSETDKVSLRYGVALT